MTHDHITPFPTAAEDLYDWLERDWKYKGRRTGKTQFMHALDMVIQRVKTDRQLAEFLAGYTAQCGACR